MVNKREDQAFSDPATFVVIKNSLYAAAEEMKVVLAKTAYSPITKSLPGANTFTQSSTRRAGPPGRRISVASATLLRRVATAFASFASQLILTLGPAAIVQ